jgi:hypothetical protein
MTKKRSLVPNASRTRKRKSGVPPWPYYKDSITGPELKRRLSEMKALSFKISNEPRQPIAIKRKTEDIVPLTFNGRYVTFIDDDYLQYDVLPLIYSEPELLKCEFRGQPSAMEVYKQRGSYLWSQYDGHEDYREYLFQNIKTCNNFRPTLSMQVYEFLGNARSVLDFSAGWGDRLFAACVTGRTYLGIDPNMGNRGIYDAIIKNHGDPEKQRVISYGAEYVPSAVLSKHMSDLGIASVDLVFTSPPFYDYETYAGTAQSSMGYSDAPHWLVYWLGHVVYKYAAYLKPGGYLGLYLQDTGPHTYVEPLTFMIKSYPKAFGLTCCGLAYSTKLPMIIFQKDKNPNMDASVSSLFTDVYPEHAALASQWNRARDLLNTDMHSVTRALYRYVINTSPTNQPLMLPKDMSKLTNKPLLNQLLREARAEAKLIGAEPAEPVPGFEGLLK